MNYCFDVAPYTRPVRTVQWEGGTEIPLYPIIVLCRHCRMSDRGAVMGAVIWGVCVFATCLRFKIALKTRAEDGIITLAIAATK